MAGQAFTDIDGEKDGVVWTAKSDRVLQVTRSGFGHCQTRF